MIENAGIADEDVERAWRLTRAAYDDPEFEGLEIDDTRAIIDSTGSSLHVAFRGTATPLNAAHDVAFLLRPLADFPALRVGEDPWAARVHSGFAKMASNVSDRLAERLEKWPRRTVVLSGHSLGGALAILVGGALKGRGRTVQICTFGAPPPGDAQYARLLDGVPCLRFANRCDPVPRSLGGADHGGLGGLVDLPMVREYVHVGTHVELEPWSETWRHAVEAVAGRQAGAALVSVGSGTGGGGGSTQPASGGSAAASGGSAPAPAPAPASAAQTAQGLWSLLGNSVTNAATRIASKTLEVHSVDTYEAHLRAFMAKRRAALEGPPAEAKIGF